MTSSWIKTITSPFRKACHTIFHNQQPSSSSSSSSSNSNSRDKKSHRRETAGGGQVDGHQAMNGGVGIMDHLHGEVMACGYEDVQVMWSILDKPNRHPPCNLLVR